MKLIDRRELHALRIDDKEGARKGRSKPGLLALARTFRRMLHRMAGPLRLIHPGSLGAVTGLLRVPMRGFLLMRGVRMILGLEVLGLVRRTFAIAGHGFSNVGSDHMVVSLRRLPRAIFDLSQAGRYATRRAAKASASSKAIVSARPRWKSPGSNKSPRRGGT